MAKKEIFHKLTSYKEQLELILEEKSFSIEAKNLLLNMLYKIENSYNDFEMVKRYVDDKKDLVEAILRIVKECNDIEIIDPSSKEMTKFKKKNITFEVNKKDKKIKTSTDEKALLDALYNLAVDNKIYINEDYSMIRNSLPYIIIEGKNSSRNEIIRDFNAWSWNTDLNDITDFECNLIYQNMQILLGKEFMKEWVSLDQSKDLLNILKNELNECFNNEKETNEFLNILFKLSIIIYCKKDKKEKERLEEEYEINLEEFNRLNETEKLIDDITKLKQKNTKQIEKIDKILNNKELLQKELEKSTDDEGKFITEEELVINLKRKRRKLEKNIKESNKLLDPKYYSEYKQRIDNNVKILNAVKELNKKEEYMLKLQKYFIKGMKNKISLLNTKKSITDMVYIIRYYNFIPYSKEKFIKDVSEIRTDLNDIEELLIDKMEQNKLLNKFSNLEKFDRKLIKKIFKLRIINLEKINLEFQKGERIRIIFYDDDTIEKGFEVNGQNIKILKYNKKIRLFS